MIGRPIVISGLVGNQSQSLSLGGFVFRNHLSSRFSRLYYAISGRMF